jgi:hypothetical protein
LENCYPWITEGTLAVTQNKLLFIRDTETKRAMTNGLELGPKIVHQKVLELFSTCYKCHRYGHKISECPEKNFVKSQDNTKGINRKKGSSFITVAKNQALPEKWYVDSGSSNHITPNKKTMSKFSTNAPQLDITSANNEVIKSQGVGNVLIVLKNSETVSEITNVLYVPDATVNILSISSTIKREYCMFFSKDGCRIFDQKGYKVIGRQVATAKEVKGVYEPELHSPQRDQQKCFVTENTHPDKNIHNSQELRHR